MRRPSLPGSLIALSLFAAGCDDPPKPAATASAAPVVSAAPPAPPKPKSAPQLAATADELKVGFEIILMDKPEGRGNLKKLLAESKEFFDGKDVPLVVDRKAKIVWLQAMLAELGAVGASGFLIKTETRKDYPAELRFVPATSIKDPQPCTVTSMILEDRGTAVWKIAGGTAMKRAKGLAGPDLSMNQETLERVGQQCKGSTLLYVSGHESIEWGLIYDLAASSKGLPKATYDTFVLLPKVPVAGRKVDVLP